MTDNGWLSVKDAAGYLGLNSKTVYEMAAKGQLVHYRIGPNNGWIKFRASDLDAYLESVRVGPKAKVVARAVPTKAPYVPKHPLDGRS